MRYTRTHDYTTIATVYSHGSKLTREKRRIRGGEKRTQVRGTLLIPFLSAPRAFAGALSRAVTFVWIVIRVGRYILIIFPRLGVLKIDKSKANCVTLRKYIFTLQLLSYEGAMNFLAINDIEESAREQDRCFSGIAILSVARYPSSTNFPPSPSHSLAFLLFSLFPLHSFMCSLLRFYIFFSFYKILHCDGSF